MAVSFVSVASEVNVVLKSMSAFVVFGARIETGLELHGTDSLIVVRCRGYSRR